MNKTFIVLLSTVIMMASPIVAITQKPSKARFTKSHKIVTRRTKTAARQGRTYKGLSRRSNKKVVGRTPATRPTRRNGKRNLMTKKALIAGYKGRNSVKKFVRIPAQAAPFHAPVTRAPLANSSNRSQKAPRPTKTIPSIQTESGSSNYTYNGNAEVVLDGIRIKAVKGDITKQKVDAIVNAANEQLAAGAGVCGAIFAAAGKSELQKACNNYPSKNGVRCTTGQAKITPSFKLKDIGISHIIHAVGPDCRVITDDADRDLLLTQAYRNSLVVAGSHNLKSIAFPSISTGIYKFPQERAAQKAVEAVMQYIGDNKNTSIKEIYFVFTSDDAIELFNKTLTKKVLQ